MACVEEGAKPGGFPQTGPHVPAAGEENGVLEREGHTEATVDLCRLAGLKECGLCCEIMREDGTMMRTAELLALAEQFGIKFITIRDLQAYRKCHEKLVDQVTAVNMPTKYGDFKAYGFVSRLNGEHHVALVKGGIGDGKDVLCRVHSECLTGDTFGSLRCDCGQQLAAAMTQIERRGPGHPALYAAGGPGASVSSTSSRPTSCRSRAWTRWRPIWLWAFMETSGVFPRRADPAGAWRQSLRLLTNNPDKVYQLSGFGLEITRAGPHPDRRHRTICSTSRPSRRKWATSSVFGILTKMKEDT